MFNWWPLRGFQRINERKKDSCRWAKTCYTQGLSSLEKIEWKKLENHFARVLILGLASRVLFLVCLWGNRKRESGQARDDVAHQDPWRAGTQACAVGEEERDVEGFSVLAGRWLSLLCFR